MEYTTSSLVFIDNSTCFLPLLLHCLICSSFPVHLPCTVFSQLVTNVNAYIWKLQKDELRTHKKGRKKNLNPNGAISCHKPSKLLVQILFCFLYSQLFCCGFACVLGIIDMLPWPNFDQPDGLWFESGYLGGQKSSVFSSVIGRCLCSVGAKQPSVMDSQDHSRDQTNNGSLSNKPKSSGKM